MIIIVFDADGRLHAYRFIVFSWDICIRYYIIRDNSATTNERGGRFLLENHEYSYDFFKDLNDDLS